VRGSVRKRPNKHEVVVELFCFCTPRIIMHRWLASNDAHPFRCEHFLQGLGDLHRHALLHLQAPRKHIDDARNF